MFKGLEEGGGDVRIFYEFKVPWFLDRAGRTQPTSDPPTRKLAARARHSA